MYSPNQGELSAREKGRTLTLMNSLYPKCVACVYQP